MKKKMPDAPTFLKMIATPLTDEVRSIEGLKKFTTNPVVIGAHAEESVRRFVSRVVHPLRTCTGAVISEELMADPKKIPQVDTIVWMPAPVPSLFEAGNFGIVPRGSSIAILEIKRSAYHKVGEALAKRLADSVVQRLVADNPPDWPVTTKPDLYPDFPAMGVVCIQQNNLKDSVLDDLRGKGRVVILLDARGDTVVPNTEDIYRLVNFLIRARQRASLLDGKVFANIEAISGNR